MCLSTCLKYIKIRTLNFYTNSRFPSALLVVSQLSRVWGCSHHRAQCPRHIAFQGWRSGCVWAWFRRISIFQKCLPSCALETCCTSRAWIRSHHRAYCRYIPFQGWRSGCVWAWFRRISIFQKFLPSCSLQGCCTSRVRNLKGSRQWRLQKALLRNKS